MTHKCQKESIWNFYFRPYELEKDHKYNHNLDKYCSRKHLFWIKCQWKSNGINWEID